MGRKGLLATLPPTRCAPLLLGLLALAVSVTGCLTQQPSAGLQPSAAAGIAHYEYVFPDGHMYVYDMDHGHHLLKDVLLPTSAGMRGVVGNAASHALYISYGSDASCCGSLLKYDLVADKIIWTKTYTHGVDDLAITPDGSRIYMPAGENNPGGNDRWYIEDAQTGNDLGSFHGGPDPHDTIISLSGRHVYMGARNTSNTSTYLAVADTATNRVIRRIGPFQRGVRPFTINSSETLVYASTTGLLGFQVADLTTGKILFTVDLTQLGFADLTQLGFTGEVGGPDDPSHGVAMSPDERRLAVVDWPNNMVHIFDISGVPASAPRKVADIALSRSMQHNESPCAYDCLAVGWLTYSRDGRFLYVADAGDVIDTATNRVLTNLDPLANTRKMIEVDWHNQVPVFIPNNMEGVGYGGRSMPLSSSPAAHVATTSHLSSAPARLPSKAPVQDLKGEERNRLLPC